MKRFFSFFIAFTIIFFNSVNTYAYSDEKIYLEEEINKLTFEEESNAFKDKDFQKRVLESWQSDKQYPPTISDEIIYYDVGKPYKLILKENKKYIINESFIFHPVYRDKTIYGILCISLADKGLDVSCYLLDFPINIKDDVLAIVSLDEPYGYFAVSKDKVYDLRARTEDEIISKYHIDYDSVSFKQNTIDKSFLTPIFAPFKEICAGEACYEHMYNFY